MFTIVTVLPAHWWNNRQLLGSGAYFPKNINIHANVLNHDNFLKIIIFIPYCAQLLYSFLKMERSLNFCQLQYFSKNKIDTIHRGSENEQIYQLIHPEFTTNIHTCTYR